MKEQLWKIAAVFLTAAMLCPAGAGAATLVTASPAAMRVQGELPIENTMLNGFDLGSVLLDGEPATVAEVPLQNEVTFRLKTVAAVDAVWVRNGFCTSSADYAFYGRATQITVELKGDEGWLLGSWSYSMDDYMDDVTWNSAWQNGYQALTLPRRVSGVRTVSLRVDAVTGGGGISGMIGDVCITGVTGSTSAVTASPATSMATTRPTAGTTVKALANQKLATRTGPATEYTEPGTFNLKGQYVSLVSLAYDENGVPWVQCEIWANGKPQRVYTGLKRFDTSTFDVNELPVETPLYWDASMRANVEVIGGPDIKYGSIHQDVYRGQNVTIIAFEGSYAQIQFTVYTEKKDKTELCRGWVPYQALDY